ncbi:MAG TPA: hypothetical protein VEY67_09170 [Candidatus Dormibacteraeota bacterium]|nr:hypothetical protein [Candidatus Dormibacteraeota bacterium]
MSVIPPAPDETRRPLDGPPATASRPAERAPGWREVLVVAVLVVAAVLGAAVVTGLLPESFQRVVFHQPLLIGFLVLGTIVVMWSVARRRPPS